MISLKYFLVLFIMFSLHVLHKAQARNELNVFLNLKISEYGNWLQTKNLDPSPPQEILVVIGGSNETVSIYAELGHQFSVGHSKNITFGYASSDLISREFSFDISHTLNVTFKGSYKGYGIVAGKPLEGEGDWFISFTPQGFIDLSTMGVGKFYYD